MSNIKWEADFSYQAEVGETNQLGGRAHRIHSIPVVEFSVKGGTVRTINLESTNNTSVQLELEQARTYKNLSLALMLTDAFRRTQLDNPGLYWVYDLLELGARNLPFSMEFKVKGSVQGKVTQAFRLVGKDVKIMQPQEPTKPGGIDYRVMVVRLEAQKVDLFQGFHQKPQFIEAE